MNTERYTILDTATQVLEKVEQAIQSISDSAPHIWLSTYSSEQLLDQAHAITKRMQAGIQLPLAGVTVAVKDNIDVAGLPTTCAAPWTSYIAEDDASCIRRLRDAGAIILGKSNMDQFATGLVGTRSPYGAVSCANDSNLISGGSSSGSAVAVAAKTADIALGTDTAGSGRIPAAFNCIYGIKPTLGLIPVTGVTPACPSFDAVSIFCRDLSLGERALAVMSGPDGADPHAREFSVSAPLAMKERPTLLAPIPENLTGMDGHWLHCFETELDRLKRSGYTIRRMDISMLLETAQLLYGGSLVAERFASIGSVYAESFDPDAGEDETVRSIILDAKKLTASSLVEDQQHLQLAKLKSKSLMDGADALVLPTTTRHPSIEDVRSDPIGVNSDLGRFTNFVNLLDLSAIAIPCANDPTVGITFISEAFHDYALLDLARRIDTTGIYRLHDSIRSAPAPSIGHNLFIVGEHMRGLALNYQLQDAGALFISEADTARSYSLVRLNTDPIKPTLIRQSRQRTTSAVIHGELWRIPTCGLVNLLTSLPQPMALGPVELDDGRIVTGFGVDSRIYEDSENISTYGGWRNYISQVTPHVSIATTD